MIIDILNKALEAEGKGRAAMFDMDFPENYTLVPVASVSEKEWIDNKYDEFLAEHNAQEYARKRKEEYPDWGTQLNKIYDDGLTKWKSEMVDPIKAKWPKDNSGPV